MNALDFLSKQLAAWDSLSPPMKQRSSATQPLIETMASLVMPDVELNDSQRGVLGSWIEYIGNMASHRKPDYPQIRAMELATYINSCYRPR